MAPHRVQIADTPAIRSRSPADGIPYSRGSGPGAIRSRSQGLELSQARSQSQGIRTPSQGLQLRPNRSRSQAAELSSVSVFSGKSLRSPTPNACSRSQGLFPMNDRSPSRPLTGLAPLPQPSPLGVDVDAKDPPSPVFPRSLSQGLRSHSQGLALRLNGIMDPNALHNTPEHGNPATGVARPGAGGRPGGSPGSRARL